MCAAPTDAAMFVSVILVPQPARVVRALGRSTGRPNAPLLHTLGPFTSWLFWFCSLSCSPSRCSDRMHRSCCPSTLPVCSGKSVGCTLQPCVGGLPGDSRLRPCQYPQTTPEATRHQTSVTGPSLGVTIRTGLLASLSEGYRLSVVTPRAKRRGERARVRTLGVLLVVLAGLQPLLAVWSRGPWLCR